MSYLEILNEEILPALVLLFPVTIRILWWTQDGAPVHCVRKSIIASKRYFEIELLTFIKKRSGFKLQHLVTFSYRVT